jgi:hypothetical protein
MRFIVTMLSGYSLDSKTWSDLLSERNTLSGMALEHFR